MTPPPPISDFRKMSLKPSDIFTSVSRSQSDTSYEGLAFVMAEKNGRRSSEWTTKEDSGKMVLRPLQLNTAQSQNYKDFNSLLYRRLSKVSPSEPTTKQAHGVTRSYSVKSVKKFAEARNRHRGSSIPTEGNHYGAKVKERTVSNRSLPLPGDESEYLRLRNFSITSKGVINRGDSFRSRSSSYVPSDIDTKKEDTESRTEATGQCSPLREDSKDLTNVRKTFRVLILGAPDVGKSTMWKQFMTSEYICEDDLSNDREIDRVITVVLNNEESQMEFDEETLQEENIYVTRPETPDPDAYVIVYSVTDRKSYSLARHILSQVERHVDTRAVILVGNKTDLVRLRAVTTEEGKALAKDRNCKFIETSVAINHQIDELLVGTLSQIRIKAKVAEKLKKKRDSQGSNRKSSVYSGSKASGVLKKILRRACLKSKSCDNLHVL